MDEKNIKAQVEAALFLTDKPLKATAVARIINADVQVVRQTILELIHDYEERNGGLEISDDNGYMVQVKDEFSSLVDEFVPIEMPTSLIRTLSAIAIKQPVMQSEIIKIRGAGAYEHIKELMNRELIHKREEGRSPTLTTTKKFQEYFRLSKDGKSLRSILSEQEKEAARAQAELEMEEGAEAGDLLDTMAAVLPTGLEGAASAADIEGSVPDQVTDEATGADEDGTFDASPDPDGPSIGAPAEGPEDEAGGKSADDESSQVASGVTPESVAAESSSDTV